VEAVVPDTDGVVPGRFSLSASMGERLLSIRNLMP
jgi:hypothetical protein